MEVLGLGLGVGWGVAPLVGVPMLVGVVMLLVTLPHASLMLSAAAAAA